MSGNLMRVGLFSYPINNNITIRQNAMPDDVPPVQPSTTSVEAAMKARRLFKKTCRVVS